ncbi:DNA-formamidopyrimidine glycosylase family protein [Sorangium sp. So ce1014]|uniref:DNA-formamidopyrimidine glycosylase family protein n=1 Tax=Sorangium sp. So ce1014 TaxID=3133326 RepID=UPI003F5E2987
MPELPEVEHAAASLRRFLAGDRIASAEGDTTRVFRRSSRDAFERELPGRALPAPSARGASRSAAVRGREQGCAGTSALNTRRAKGAARRAARLA